MQIEVFAASMAYWAVVTLLIAWVARNIRNVTAHLKNMERRVEIKDEN